MPTISLPSVVLPQTGFADEPERLAGVEVQRDVGDRFDASRPGAAADPALTGYSRTAPEISRRWPPVAVGGGRPRCMGRTSGPLSLSPGHRPGSSMPNGCPRGVGSELRLLQGGTARWRMGSGRRSGRPTGGLMRSGGTAGNTDQGLGIVGLQPRDRSQQSLRVGVAHALGKAAGSVRSRRSAPRTSR